MSTIQRHVDLSRPLWRRLRPRRSLHRLRSKTKNKPLAFGGKFREESRRSHERLLRYPNGDTRLIRYPATESEAEAEVDNSTDTQFTEQHTDQLKMSELPSSPTELIRLIRSPAYQNAQKEYRKRIRESYQILESNPWMEKQKVYVLAMIDPSSGMPQSFTMRTRLHQDTATHRLKNMFRGPGFKGDFIQIDRLVDGVLTFIDADQAERFRSLIEAEVTQKVEMCEMTAHELFQGTMSVAAVVVLVRTDACLSLHELSTSLKDQLPLEPIN